MSMKQPTQPWLERHALRWKQIPLCRPESPQPAERGAFLGNGTLGALVFGVDEACDFPHHALQVDVGRMDAADAGGSRCDGSEWWDKWGLRHKSTRLHTGGFRLLTRGLAQAGPMRLDIAQAECQAELRTGHGAACGTIAVRAWVAAADPIIVVEVDHDGAEKRPRFVRRAMPLPGWPPARTEDREGIRVEVQPLLDGQEYAIAWTEVVEPGRVRLLVSLGVSPRIKGFSRGQADARTAAEEAWHAVATARVDGVTALQERHRTWWHAFHGRSQVSLPDARLEGFYAINTYTLGCTTRAGAPFPDETGPWSYAMGGPDDWAHCPGYPHIWLNLNAQLHFLLHLGSNHAAECGEVLWRSLAMLSDRLLGPNPDPARAVGTGGSCGYDFSSGDRDGAIGCHLVWLLHNAWLTSRYAADAPARTAWQRLLPLLAGAVNEMLSRVQPGDDGKLHLHNGQSPEYPPTTAVPHSSVAGCTDANYELAILRWGLARLLADWPQDARAPRWQTVLTDLVEYPRDDRGLRIAREVACELGHRHYSHLMMAWPFRDFTAEDPAQSALLRQSIQTWLTNPPDGKGRTGFTWAAAAALAAHCGQGDDAWRYLNTYLDAPPNGVMSQRFANTLAREWGMTLETPLGAANAVLDLLLQSHGGCLRIFPAVPTAWAEAEFLNLAAEGGFSVSARREQGQTVWVEVTSHAGESVLLRHGIDAPVQIETTGGMKVQSAGTGLRLEGPIGARVRLSRPGHRIASRPVTARFHPDWGWGDPRPAPGASQNQ